MAAAFNLTAQLNLQGPSNVKAVVSSIKKQINDAKISLNLDVGANAAKNISSITRRLNNLSKAAVQANSNVATLGSTLSSLSSSFNTASSAANANASSMARTAQSVASAGKAIQQTRTNIEEFGKQAGLAVKRFAAFSTVTAPIYALTNAINNGFKEFVNFNKEIVRLSQVTGQSVGDLGAVSKEITRLSTGLGVASSDLLQVATTLAQAGLSAEDTKIALEALAKSALAPSFESLTDTTEGAIAAMRQFGIQSRELDSALGSINAVAAAFAVEAGDIITAIQRTGGVFSAASRGVSEGTDALNEFIAIFTSVRATTRESAETIATGLRTIFTRVQRVKTIEQLRQFGIELQDAEGKFVGLFEATRRLSEGLNKIDPRSAEFATISEELGGFRQIGKVIPLIQQFAVAEQALAVAQKGTKSTSKDALIAQQSLAVQFEKTRQNFLALIREIGESSSFKAFVGVSLTLADAFINLGRALKPLLPLLLTFASIKAGGAIKEFGSGFGGVFGFGGGGLGGGGGAGTGGGGTGGRGTGGAGQSANITALTSNTSTLNTVAQALTSLNQSILALNQNVVYSNSLALNRPTRGFATGGLVPGVGNSDTVGAMLTPGEFVIRKKAVESIGAHNLAAMNSGGEVQRFEGGSPGGVRVPSGKGRGKKVRKGARGKFEHLNQSQLESLSTEEMIDYAKKQMYHIMTTGGSGMAIGKEFVEVPESRITPELAKDLIMGPNGKMGFEREIVAPFGSEKVAKSKKSEQQKRREKFFRTSRDLLTAAMQGIMAPGSDLSKAQQDAISPFLEMVTGDYSLGLSATPRLKSEEAPVASAASTLLASIQDPLAQFRKSGGKSSLSGIFPGESASKIKAAIPAYIAQLEKEGEGKKVAKAKLAQQYFDSFIGGGTASKPGHATAFAETVNQIIKNDLVRFASGGSVQKFANGGLSKEIMSGLSAAGSYEKYITKNMQSGDFLEFGMVGLIPGTKNVSNKIIDRDIGNTGKEARIHIGFLQGQGFKEQIEGNITKNLESVIVNTAKSFGSKLNSPIDPGIKKQVLEGAVLSSAAGSVFESALQMVGAPYIDKVESLKSMDFPLGLGPAAKLFGDTFPDNIPSDATRTIAGKGKGISDFLGQIERFLTTIDNQKFTKEAAAGKLPPIMSQDILGAENLLGRIEANVQGNFERAQTFNEIAQRFTLSGYFVPPISFKGQLNKKRRDKLLQALMNNVELRTEVEAKGFNYGGLIQRFARGGNISSEDTVPALLTPGEFVFNKKAAQRIGYGTLNKLNKADKVQGFNKGGTVGVQRFAGGGVIDAVGGPAAAVAAITTVLLPQIEQLASSMSNLNGQTSSLAAGFSAAIRESSSLVLSTAQVLRGVGASKGTVAATQAGVGIVGAISGFITEKSAKDLEKALLKNSEAFGKFDKNLQDLTQAPTEELRIEAAARLEKSFMELDHGVRNSVTSLNSLEIAKNIGESLGNLNISFITSLSAFSALKSATNDIVSSAQQAVRRANAAAPFANMGGAMGQAASAASGIGTITKLLGTFGKFIPYVGFAITAFSLVTEGMKLFSASTQKSDEQLNKFYKSLSQATKNSNAFQLTNQNFVENLLPEFRKLQARSTSPEELKIRLGQIGTLTSGLNELNLTFKTLVRSRLAAKGFTFSENQNFADIQKAMESGGVESERIFRQVIGDSMEEFKKQQFIQAKESQGIDAKTAGMEFNILSKQARLGSEKAADEITKVVQQFNGGVNLQQLSLQSLTDANNRVVVSLLKLDNVLVSLSAKIAQSTDKSINSFDDLDLTLSTLKGEPEQIGSRFFRREAAVLENLGAASSKDIERISGSVSRILGIPSSGEAMQRFLAPNKEGKISGDSTGLDSVQQFREITAQVEALRLLKTDVPVILRDIQTRPMRGQTVDQELIQTELSKTIGKSLSIVSGASEEQIQPIINDLAAKLLKATRGESESIKGFEDLARNSPALAEALKNGETSLKVFQSALEATAKFEDKMAEQRKKLIDLESSLIDAIISRKQSELQSAVELKKIRGEDVSFGELKDIFDVSIKELTDVGGAIPQGGTTNVQTIFDQLTTSQKAVDDFTQKIREAQKAGDNTEAKNLLNARQKESITIFRLNKALNTLVTSTELTQKAMENYADDLGKSKTQRDFLFTTLKEARTNPEAFLEKRQAVMSIAAARDQQRGFTSVTQAETFYEQGARILEENKVLQPKDIELLRIKALEYIVNSIPSNAPPDEQAKKSILEQVIEMAKKQLTLPNANLTQAEQQMNEASQALQKMLKTQITTVTTTTEQIFNEFNLDLAKILPEIINKLNAMTSKPTDQTFRSTKQFMPSPQLSVMVNTSFQNMQKRMDIFNRGLFEYQGIKGIDQELIDKARMQFAQPEPGKSPTLAFDTIETALRDAREQNESWGSLMIDNNAAQQIEIALRKIRELRELTKKELQSQKKPSVTEGGVPTTSTPSGMPSAPRGKQVDMVMEGGIVTSIGGKTVKLSPQDQKTVDSVRSIKAGGDGSPSIPPASIPTIPQQRTGAAPSQLDSGSIQKFENGATVFAKSLTEAPLQNLTDSLNSFNTTSQQLAASLEAFRNEFREGMKGQISYDGDVRVSFTDTLAVNIPKTNNTSLVEMIAVAMKPIIGAEVDKGLQKNA